MTGSCEIFPRITIFSVKKTHVENSLQDPDTREPAEHGDGGKGVLLEHVGNSED